MASLTYRTDTRRGWRLRYYDAADSRRRREVWLGELPQREAEKIRRHVEAILESQKDGTPMAGETCRWLAKIPKTLHLQLLPMLGASRNLQQAADAYLKYADTAHKPSTVRSMSGTLGQLCDTFGRRQLRSLSGDEITAWLDAQNVSPNTVGKLSKNTKTFLAWCRNQRWIDDLRLDAPSTIGRGDKSYIDSAEFQQFINHFGDYPQFQCGLALSRWAGVRVPSEVLLLTRSSIDWEGSRVHVVDAKRSKRSSRAPPVVRVCPLFPELAPYLQAIWACSDKPTDPLLPELVAMGGGTFVSRCARARDALGFSWPRLFTSVRATRETELIARFGVRAASEWIGNSPAVAAKFYELVSPEAWKEAITCVSPPTTHTTNEKPRENH